MSNVSYYTRSQDYDVIRLSLPTTVELMTEFFVAIRDYELRHAENSEYTGGTIDHVEDGLEFSVPTSSSMTGRTP